VTGSIILSQKPEARNQEPVAIDRIPETGFILTPRKRKMIGYRSVIGKYCVVLKRF
jgi:hypothetical protein